MENTHSNNPIKLTVIGGILFAAIMVIGTMWTGRSAGRDSLDAVHKVSLLCRPDICLPGMPATGCFAPTSSGTKTTFP